MNKKLNSKLLDALAHGAGSPDNYRSLWDKMRKGRSTRSPIPLEALGKGAATDRRLTLQDEEVGALCCSSDEVYELEWYLQRLLFIANIRPGKGSYCPENLAYAEGGIRKRPPQAVYLTC
ncbi:hypothetical protein llap_2133 [Limosa lapponica baueri]|uniref:Uncharacterized protein n=1 Tax=Limosa lapponica baueri TaxID=1758121 RepID=A0A2I0UNG2_LIMLA|nr:hypothetical protein llap_2133 [Limosa lapponica baueri]